MPTAEDFQKEIEQLFREAERLDFQAFEITAGALHRRVGDYPGSDHRMPVCCNVMRKNIASGDVELPNQLKKDGASFAVRYVLPR